MKIKFLSNFWTVLVLLFTASTLFSQEPPGAPTVPDILNCKFTIDSASNLCDEEFTQSTDQTYLDSFEPVVFNVYFWELRQTLGTIDPNDTQMDFEKETLDVVAALNIFYNPYNMYYKYYGRGTIDNDSLYNLSSGIYNYIKNPINYPDPTEVIIPNSFNIYVSAKFVGGTAPPFKPRVTISRGKFKEHEYSTLHEVGHSLGLLHPHYNYHGLITGEDCEHVTREKYIDGVLNPDYNADIAGDRVIDTPASSPLVTSNGDFYEVDTNCIYIGDGKDCENDTYQISPDDVHNVMAAVHEACRDRITVGQAIRMREAIEIDCYDELTPVIRTDGVASLYEPYKGFYPYPNNTYAAYDPPRFQPGFDYKFLNCYPNGAYPQPADYTDISFSYIEGGMWWYGFNKYILTPQYPSIIHKDGYAIRIEQLDQQPRKCYNTGQGPIIGGTVIKFNDNVLNTNVTITPQDSMSINNEELIDNLDLGLYNVIKNYENGNTQETLILKENN